jgi:hypothetical protein
VVIEDVHPLIFAFREPFIVLERLSQNADFLSHNELCFFESSEVRGGDASHCDSAAVLNLQSAAAAADVDSSKRAATDAAITDYLCTMSCRHSDRLLHPRSFQLDKRLDYTICMHFPNDRRRNARESATPPEKRQTHTNGRAVAIGSHQDVKKTRNDSSR